MAPMDMFWVIAGTMVVFALGFLLFPLLRHRAQAEPDEATAEITVYRERLRELRAELRNGSLTEEQFTQARRELEEAMSADLADTSSPAMPKAKRHWVTALILLLLTPSLAFLTYQQLGASEKVARVMARKQSVEQKIHNMHRMIAQLRDRLLKHPNNVQGWHMLGRSYLAINEFSKAAAALGRAYMLDKNNVAVILDYARALSASQGRHLRGASLKLVQRALELDPRNPGALWLAALGALQTGEKKKAKDYLHRLINQLPAGSKGARMARAHLAQLSSGGRGSSANSQGSQESRTVGSAQEDTQTEARVKVRVTLDPALQEEVSGASTVFVFAHAANGPPMPLAAVRRQVEDLPFTVVLDDSKAMIPSMKMSNFNKFKVGARISWSGNPMPQSGDYQGFAEGLVPANPASPVSVIINQQVP